MRDIELQYSIWVGIMFASFDDVLRSGVDLLRRRGSDDITRTRDFFSGVGNQIRNGAEAGLRSVQDAGYNMMDRVNEFAATTAPRGLRPLEESNLGMDDYLTLKGMQGQGLNIDYVQYGANQGGGLKFDVGDEDKAYQQIVNQFPNIDGDTMRGMYAAKQRVLATAPQREQEAAAFRDMARRQMRDEMLQSMQGNAQAQSYLDSPNVSNAVVTEGGSARPVDPGEAQMAKLQLTIDTLNNMNARAAQESSDQAKRLGQLRQAQQPQYPTYKNRGGSPDYFQF